MTLVSSGSRRDLAVAATKELHQTPAMPKRIGKLHDAAPVRVADGAFLYRAGGDGTRKCGVEVVDDYVAMQRRPVTGVIACRTRCASRAGRLLQQVDRRVGADEFDHAAAEAARGRQAEGRDVETLGGIKIGYVDVEQQAHRGQMSRARSAARPI